MPSMYTVYLGLHDASSVFKGGNLEQGALKVDVRQVINVCYLEILVNNSFVSFKILNLCQKYSNYLFFKL